jgi:hypothetical protein
LISRVRIHKVLFLISLNEKAFLGEDVTEFLSLKLEDGFQQMNPKVSDQLFNEGKTFNAYRDIQPGEIVFVHGPSAW